MLDGPGGTLLPGPSDADVWTEFPCDTSTQILGSCGPASGRMLWAGEIAPRVARSGRHEYRSIYTLFREPEA
jgi:hypothetical protein